MLEGIAQRNRRKQQHQIFETSLAGAAVVLGALVEFAQVRQREQFHAHGGDFAKFDRRVAVIDQRLFACRQRVKRVAAFVDQRTQVVVAANRIHEDER